MYKRLFTVVSLAVGLFAGSTSAQEKKPVLIGIDGEFSFASSTSAEAIRAGAQVAVDEINRAGGVLGGRPLRIVERDNRTLPARSRENLKAFAAMEDLVAVLCGRFSPTVLDIVPNIHELKLPLLDPWAAADGIIDHDFKPSYTFRLSLRDSWAMPTILDAMAKRGIRNVGLIFLLTGWGRSNEVVVNRYVGTHPSMKIVGIRWINNLEPPQSVSQKYLELKAAGAGGIVLVTNNNEVAGLVKFVGDLPQAERLPLYAHWGITGGGNFVDEAGPSAISKVDLAVVQTYTFIGAKRPKAAKVAAAAGKLLNVDNPRKIPSPVGVAHAYDIVHILARAVDLAKGTDRVAIRNALEQVRNYSGLVRDYTAPFTPTRHEALDRRQVFLARYAADGALERISD